MMAVILADGFSPTLLDRKGSTALNGWHWKLMMAIKDAWRRSNLPKPVFF